MNLRFVSPHRATRNVTGPDVILSLKCLSTLSECSQTGPFCAAISEHGDAGLQEGLDAEQRRVPAVRGHPLRRIPPQPLHRHPQVINVMLIFFITYRY